MRWSSVKWKISGSSSSVHAIWWSLLLCITHRTTTDQRNRPSSCLTSRSDVHTCMFSEENRPFSCSFRIPRVFQPWSYFRLPDCGQNNRRSSARGILTKQAIDSDDRRGPCTDGVWSEFRFGPEPQKGRLYIILHFAFGRICLMGMKCLLLGCPMMTEPHTYASQSITHCDIDLNRNVGPLQTDSGELF